MSLQFKLVLPILLLIMLLVAGTGGISYRESSKNIEKFLVENMEGEAQSASRALTALANSAFELMQSKATEFAVVRFLQEDPHNRENALDASEDLAEFIKNTTLFDRISIVDARGRIVASSFQESLRKTFPKDEDYYKRALQGEHVLVEPFINPETDTGYTIVALPILSGSRNVGVLFASLPLEVMYERIFKPVKIGEQGFAFGVAAPGVIVLHSNKDMLFNSNLPATADYQTMVAQGSGMLESIDNEGRPSLIFYQQDPTTKIIVGVQAALDDVFAGLFAIRNNSIILVVVSVLLGSIVLLLLIRPVIRSLQRGLAFAEDIAAGKLDGELQVYSKDETGKLADALRAIPKVLQSVVDEYETLEKNIEMGNLNARGESANFSGDFTSLVDGTNNIMNRYGMVLDNIPSPVVILDTNNKAVYLNVAASNLAGKDYAGKTCEELFGREDYNSNTCALRLSRESSSPASGETRAYPGGRAMDIHYTVIPMFTGEGKLASQLQLITDLTEIKKTQHTIIEVANQALDISNRVATASGQLSVQIEHATNGANVQRNHAETTATAMVEMNATVLEVARNAGSASEQADATRVEAQEGTVLVDQVIERIKEVNDIAQELQINMQNLGDQAEGIGDVMNVISDIADQTNLLALNAAIEAARAGEAGRGFAVVADAVRQLAEKTMTATTEVENSIKGIQAAATTNINKVSDATKSVSAATEQAGISGKSLHKILEFAVTNSSLIAGIATAAEQQSATSEEVSRAITEITTIANETAKGMLDSSQAVQEVARMAQELRSVLANLQE